MTFIQRQKDRKLRKELNEKRDPALDVKDRQS